MKNLFSKQGPLRPKFGKIPYARWEWFTMRTLFALLCIYPSAPIFLGLQTQVAPNGIAQFVDLTFLSTPTAHEVLSWAFPILLGLYVIGIFPFAVTAGLFAIHVAICTLINSQGHINHTGQVVGYVLLGQLLFHCYRWIRCITGKESAKESAAHLHRDLIYGTQQGLVAAYVIAGLSKLIKSGWDWVASIPNMVLQLEKNYGMDYHDTLQEATVEGTEFATQLINNYPTVAKIILGGGLLLELFAFLALWNRTFMALFGIALISMHEVISSAMHLGFHFNKAALAIFFINVPFWAFALGRHLGSRNRLQPA